MDAELPIQICMVSFIHQIRLHVLFDRLFTMYDQSILCMSYFVIAFMKMMLKINLINLLGLVIMIDED